VQLTRESVLTAPSTSTTPILTRGSSAYRPMRWNLIRPHASYTAHSGRRASKYNAWRTLRRSRFMRGPGGGSHSINPS